MCPYDDILNTKILRKIFLLLDFNNLFVRVESRCRGNRSLLSLPSAIELDDFMDSAELFNVALNIGRLRLLYTSGR